VDGSEFCLESYRWIGMQTVAQSRIKVARGP